MQNQIVKTLLLFGALVLAGCMEMQNPYSDGLNRLTVSAVYPSDHADATRAGVAVTVESVSGGSAYSLLTDASASIASTTTPSYCKARTPYSASGNTKTGFKIQ